MVCLRLVAPSQASCYFDLKSDTSHEPSPVELGTDAIDEVTEPKGIAARRTLYTGYGASRDVIPRSNINNYTPVPEGPETTVSEVTLRGPDST